MSSKNVTRFEDLRVDFAAGTKSFWEVMFPTSPTLMSDAVDANVRVGEQLAGLGATAGVSMEGNAMCRQSRDTAALRRCLWPLDGIGIDFASDTTSFALTSAMTRSAVQYSKSKTVLRLYCKLYAAILDRSVKGYAAMSAKTLLHVAIRLYKGVRNVLCQDALFPTE